MKLSDAIRLGAMLRPQGFRAIFSNGTSCAMGAALEAHGIPYNEAGPIDNDLCEMILKIQRPIMHIIDCPCCGAHELHGRNVIEHLNDEHRWTREAIAYWVESIEPASHPSPVAASEVREEVEA